VRPLRTDAPAKLNLSLRVVGRRADGYHELESEIVLLDLADRLLLLPGGAGLRVESAPELQVPVAPEENLAWRGLDLGLAGQPAMACLVLEKRVPVAAGLGGGSSDAAAAWHLGRAWRGAGRETADEVAGLAAIGADVPFFASRVARGAVAGIGEVVSPLARPPDAAVVIALAPFGLLTREVFAELRKDEWGAADAAAGGNDLLAPARRLRPEIDDLFRLVSAAGAEPHLTGSGPTVFALSEDVERIAAVAGRLRRAGVRTLETRLRAEGARIEELDVEPEES